jgi:predicted AAA+ superfamily ATPase
LVQSVLRGTGLQVHFYRDYTIPGNRRSSFEEVDFVVEALDGTVIPVEVKFRRNIRPEDEAALRRFIERYDAPFGILVTRDLFRCDGDDLVLRVPVLEFLSAL